MSTPEKESRREKVLRMSNEESNRFTKDCIRTALIYLMNEQEFDKITITSIINRSGISRAAFYRNYSSKEDILREFDQELSLALTEIHSTEKYQNNPHQFFLDFYYVIQKNQKEFQLLIQAKYPPEFIWHTHLKVRPEDFDTAEAYYRSVAASSVIKDVTLAWFKNGLRETPEEMADMMMGMLAKK